MVSSERNCLASTERRLLDVEGRKAVLEKGGKREGFI